ncbi:hypothetical protein B0H16DRAFT_1745784 [Mycena metata]|uniref:Uncharacterized protein n=1 Tax=Mycena metata TaxID=1033252 RepID=A0AAD7H258_9AGAR|nr:hypothetical protein B0H16DRAFT_1745784 [Mycena metata]
MASPAQTLLALGPPPLELPNVWIADETKCQVRVTIYAEPDEPAVHALWMVGMAHSLDPHTQQYPIPFACNSWRELQFYSAFDRDYHPVDGPIDMTDRGAFLLFRKPHRAHCPDISHWEEHAGRLTDKEAGNPNLTPSKATIRPHPSNPEVSNHRGRTPSQASRTTHGSSSRTSDSTDFLMPISLLMDDPNLARSILLRFIAETGQQYDLDAFKVRDDAVNHLLNVVDVVEGAIARLSETPHTQLPRLVALVHDEKLNWARQRLEELDTLVLPCKSSQEGRFVEETAPELSTLPAVYPLGRYEPKSNKRFIRVLIYSQRSQAAIQQRWRAPDLECFSPEGYPGPPNGSSWSDFEYYSPHTDTFVSIGDPIDLLGFGRIVILRAVGLGPLDCLHLQEWQQLAMESCGNDEAHESLPTDASSPPAAAPSPLPPSSAPSMSPVSPTRNPSSDEYGPSSTKVCYFPRFNCLISIYLEGTDASSPPRPSSPVPLFPPLGPAPKPEQTDVSSPPRPSLPIASSPPFGPAPILSAWSPYPRSSPAVDSPESPCVLAAGPRTSIKRKTLSSPSPVAHLGTKRQKLDNTDGVAGTGDEKELED